MPRRQEPRGGEWEDVMPNRAWFWPGMRDGLLVIGIAALALGLGALASDGLGPERSLQPVVRGRSSPRPQIVSGMTPGSEIVDCQCNPPTAERDRDLMRPS